MEAATIRYILYIDNFACYLWKATTFDYDNGWSTASATTGNTVLLDYTILTKMIPMFYGYMMHMYHQNSDIRHSFIGNKIVDHSDIVGASSVAAALTTSSFPTYHLRPLLLRKLTRD